MGVARESEEGRLRRSGSEEGLEKDLAEIEMIEIQFKQNTT